MMNNRGFTLIEVTVTVAIIALLSTGILFGVSEARQKSRDAERVADLRLLQSAIELYKQRYGRYPVGCNGPGVWSGQDGSDYACNPGQQYIIGLAPEFIPTLPKDPAALPDALSGYVYTVNSDGSVYKLMARRTVEADEKLMTGYAGYTHALKSCDATHSGTGICDQTAPSDTKPNHCQENDATFTRTYAVWGGFAKGADSMAVEQATEDIICDIP